MSATNAEKLSGPSASRDPVRAVKGALSGAAMDSNANLGPAWAAVCPLTGSGRAQCSALMFAGSWRVEVGRIIAETPIEKSALRDAILASRYGDSLNLRKSTDEALIAKSVSPTLE
jgi:hypothetical protein